MKYPLTWQPVPQYADVVPQKPNLEQHSPGLHEYWRSGAPQEPSVVTGRVEGAAPEGAGEHEAEGTGAFDDDAEGTGTVDDEAEGTGTVDDEAEGTGTVEDEAEGTGTVDDDAEGTGTADDEADGTGAFDDDADGAGMPDADGGRAVAVAVRVDVDGAHGAQNGVDARPT